MKIAIADDVPEMRALLLRSVQEQLAERGEVQICGQAKNGQELITIVENNPDIEMVFSDLRMPVLDGLSAMVYLKNKFPHIQYVMVSSESFSTVTQNKKARTVNASFEEKLNLMEKIATRVKNKEFSGDKCNSILAGCEKLELDPIRMTKHYGGNGYIRKPVSGRKVKTMLDKLATSQDFITSGVM